MDDDHAGDRKYEPAPVGSLTDDRLVVGLLQAIRRDLVASIESNREQHERTREAIERLALAHEDNALRIAALEQNAAKRRIARK